MSFCESQQLAYLPLNRPYLVVLGTLATTHPVAPSVTSLQINGKVYEAVVAGLVGEGLDVLAETPPVVHDVHGEAETLGEPIEVSVETGRLPVGVGEDGAVGDGVECSLACHESHDGAPSRVEGLENLVPDPSRLVDGNDGVEGVGLLCAVGIGDDDYQQVGLVGVKVCLVVPEGVLEGVLPAVLALLLSPLHQDQTDYPVAVVWVSHPVVEDVQLAVEEGPGDEAPVALALDELLVLVDQGDALGGRGLGEGRVACGDGGERRQKQRCGQRDTSSLTRVTPSVDGAWAKAGLLAGMAVSAARSSAAASGISRLALPGVNLDCSPIDASSKGWSFGPAIECDG